MVNQIAYGRSCKTCVCVMTPVYLAESVFTRNNGGGYNKHR